jgi:hypothetical protein
MFGIYANYSYYNSDGYHCTHEIPTFYVNADSSETAVKIARDILWTSRDDKFEYAVSAYAV